MMADADKYPPELPQLHTAHLPYTALQRDFIYRVFFNLRLVLLLVIEKASNVQNYAARIVYPTALAAVRRGLSYNGTLSGINNYDWHNYRF